HTQRFGGIRRAVEVDIPTSLGYQRRRGASREQASVCWYHLQLRTASRKIAARAQTLYPCPPLLPQRQWYCRAVAGVFQQNGMGLFGGGIQEERRRGFVSCPSCLSMKQRA